MTQDQFLKYHKTGYIQSDAYESYEKPEGLSWAGPKSKYPVLYSVKEFGGKKIEFRKRGEKLRYVKTDPETDRQLRDANGDIVYLSDEEMRSEGIPLTDTSMYAFDGDTVVGIAANEFGADGVWVTGPYQKLGIGTYLLMEFRKQFRAKRKIGQMTPAGESMTRSLHKKYVQQALQDGKSVSPEVLKDYPDLQSKQTEVLPKTY
jgi:hypothetical protein